MKRLTISATGSSNLPDQPEEGLAAGDEVGLHVAVRLFRIERGWRRTAVPGGMNDPNRCGRTDGRWQRSGTDGIDRVQWQMTGSRPPHVSAGGRALPPEAPVEIFA